MVFSSLVFLFVFLPLSIIAFFLVRKKIRYLCLTFFSLIFYFWGENFLVWVILTSSLLDYFVALGIDATDKYYKKDNIKLVRRILLFTSIAVNLGLLGYFKYANFFVENVDSTIKTLGLNADIFKDFTKVALPLGISFYTFQSMSYTIDVYNKVIKANKNITEFLCYVTMFPQLVAGPIVRYRDIKDQFDDHKIEAEDFFYGIKRFCFGLAKKVLIANNVAIVADAVFKLSENSLNMSLAWLGILCYTLQIYFDFSGYSDMAIGLGRMFGFKYLENFNFPYIAKSIQDFWRRWHISLSTWFRDYVYIPLGGNRKGGVRTYLNLFIVFFVCGLWHGASWNFIVWGMFHGSLLVTERLFLSKVLKRLWSPFQHVYAMLMVFVGWVFFKADTMPEALTYLKTMFVGNTTEYVPQTTIELLLTPMVIIALVLGLVLSINSYQFLLDKANNFIKKRTPSHWWSWVEYGFLYTTFAQCLFLFLFSAMKIFTNAYNPFIYFRF